MIQRPSSTDQLADVFAQFKKMREAQPVCYDEATSSWHLFGYDEVLRVLTDSTHFSAGGADSAALLGSSHLIALDAPRHELVRRTVGQALTPHAINQLAPHIKERVRALLDQVPPGGSLDVIDDLAVPLSLSILAELLNIPADHQQALQQWTLALEACPASLSTGIFPQVEQRVQADLVVPELEAFFMRLLEQRRLSPHQDVMSRFLAAEVDGVHPSEREIVACCRLLLAGQQLLTNLLGNAMFCLLEHPEVIERLRQVPAPIYSTIDEVLRYLPPIWMVRRMATREVMLGSQHIPAQARVCAWLVSANRDGRHFADPGRFEIDRIPNRHLSFSDDGNHSCLGAGLARLTARIALSMLIQHLVDPQPRTELAFEVIEHPLLFGVKHLPITLTPSPRFT
jgi:cytochrome P450 family 109